MSGGPSGCSSSQIIDPKGIKLRATSCKSPIKDGKLPPEVQAAIGSWAAFPDEKSAENLEKRLNEGLKDSDYSVSIKSGTIKGPDGVELPVTKVTFTNKQTKERSDFSYSFDMPGAAALKGKILDNEIFVLGKEQAESADLAKHLSEINQLRKLDSMFNIMDKNDNGVLSDDEPSGAPDASLKKFVKDNLKDLSASPDAKSGTAGDAPGLQKQKIRDAHTSALGDAVAEVMKLNSGKVPVEIREAFQALIGFSATKEGLEALQKSMNAKVAPTGSEIKLALENQKGPHGDSVRQITVTLADSKQASEQRSFSYRYDTLRGPCCRYIVVVNRGLIVCK